MCARRNWAALLRLGSLCGSDTQRIAAERCGIDVHTVARIERGDPGVAIGSNTCDTWVAAAAINNQLSPPKKTDQKNSDQKIHLWSKRTRTL